MIRESANIACRNRPAFKLQTLFQIHNLILTAGSGLLLALMLEEMYVGFTLRKSVTDDRKCAPLVEEQLFLRYLQPQGLHSRTWLVAMHVRRSLLISPFSASCRTT